MTDNAAELSGDEFSISNEKFKQRYLAMGVRIKQLMKENEDLRNKNRELKHNCDSLMQKENARIDSELVGMFTKKAKAGTETGPAGKAGCQRTTYTARKANNKAVIMRICSKVVTLGVLHYSLAAVILAGVAELIGVWWAVIPSLVLLAVILWTIKDMAYIIAELE